MTTTAWVRAAEPGQAAVAGAKPWLPWTLAGLVSGALFLVPGALLLLSASPLLLISRGRADWRLGKGAVVGLGLAMGAGLAGVSWAGDGLASGQLYLLTGALPAALLLHGGRRWGSGARQIAAAAVAWLGVAVGILLIAGTGGSIPELARGVVEGGFDALVAGSLGRAGEDLVAVEAVRSFAGHRDLVVPWVVRLLPSLLAVVGLLGMWVNVVYVRWFAGVAEEKESDLCEFVLPFGFIWWVLAAMATLCASLGLSALGVRWEPAWVVAGNALLLMGVLYWLQGVAVVNWWFLRLPLTPVPRALGIGLQAAAMAIPVFSLAYLVTGLSDVWLDLRRRQGDDEVTSRNGARR